MPVPTPHAAFERKSLREIAADQIRTAILDGTLEPGEVLNDGDLQDWLGVSRTPIREALNDLVQIGLVEMAAQRYTRVAVPKPEERDQLLQTLGAVVGGVVRVTVPTLTERQRADILTQIDTVTAAVEQRDAALSGRAGWDVVFAFIDACKNPVLVSATRDVVAGLLYRVSVTRTAESVHWDDLEEGFPLLRAALLAEDAIAAELAVEHTFRLAGS